MFRGFYLPSLHSVSLCGLVVPCWMLARVNSAPNRLFFYRNQKMALKATYIVMCPLSTGIIQGLCEKKVSVTSVMNCHQRAYDQFYSFIGRLERFI